MKLLIFGNNLITTYFIKFIEEENIEYIIETNIDKIKEYLSVSNITHCIYDNRKSYGKNIYSTKYIEDKLEVNIINNLYYPIIINNLCNKYNIHFTYLGEGCIWKKNDSIEPDLKVSSHSLVNIYTEKILTDINKNILYLRTRYPIVGNFDPRCYLMKLITYKKILKTDNSVTILKDMFPIILNMLKNKTTGIYNLFNTGYINSIDLLINYKINVDTSINIKEMNLEEHNTVVGERSNVILNNNKLLNYCEKNKIPLLNVEDSIKEIINNKKKYCQELNYCLCCLNKNNILLNLGNQPLANDFHSINYINKIYPLILKICSHCFHCQLSHSVKPEILFKNYKYVSGTSQTGKDFFKWNANFIHNYYGKVGKILDIACNDGSQLNEFKKLGWKTYGVDPAENICPIAEKEGHQIYCDFWNDKIADKLPIMDVITAQNVFAHTPYIDDFLQTCKKVMNNNSSLFIQTSQRNMILNGEFDTTYHEHISFFNTKSMNILTQRNGLVLNRVLEHSIHGKSYIFEIKLQKDMNIYNIEKQLQIENNLGLYNKILYENFRINSESTIDNIKVLIQKYQNKEYKIIGFGAAAKGQTLICYGNIDLDYIIDENPLKIGTYSPKLNIPIVSIDYFKKDPNKKILIIILAWNFAEEIKEKIEKCKGNKDIVIIEKYFPNIVIS